MTRKRKLPKRIELIDEKRGDVIEFEFKHAERILKLQESTKLSKLKIFNTKLYKYEQGLISHNEQRQVETDSDRHEASGGTD